MKILALGATGAIGGQLISLLAPHGHDLYVTSRAARPSKDNVHYLQGNAREATFLQEVLSERWDAIIDFMVYTTATFQDRVDAFLGATDQYFLVSSARVFAETDGLITESSPRLLDVSQDAEFLATDEYALSKARQEDLLRASGRKNWTIVRPYITFGESRFQLGTLEKEAWMYRALKGRSIVFCEPMMDKWTTLTDGHHVADMIASLVGNPAALGEDFNLAGEHTVRWKEILSLYLDELETQLGQRPNVELQDLESFCQAAKSVPQVIYDRMYNRRFDPAKIFARTGQEKLGDSRPTLKAHVEQHLKAGTFLPIDPKAEALRDRAVSERTGLGEFASTKRKIGYLMYRHMPLELIYKTRAL